MYQLKTLTLLRLLILVIQLKKTDYNAKIGEVEKKIFDHDHYRYIATQEFTNLTTADV